MAKLTVRHVWSGWLESSKHRGQADVDCYLVVTGETITKRE